MPLGEGSGVCRQLAGYAATLRANDIWATMTPLDDKTLIVKRVCAALAAGDTLKASEIARTDYPFAAQTTGKRSFSALAATSVFQRDGFIDRYSGTQLVFPGVLRLLSRLLPTEFPAHPNWKMSESHI